MIFPLASSLDPGLSSLLAHLYMQCQRAHEERIASTNAETEVAPSRALYLFRFFKLKNTLASFMV